MTKKKVLRSSLFAGATAALWFLWIPLTTSGNLRMDSERMIHTPTVALNQYIQEGRSGLVALLRLFGLDTWHPVRSGLLFLLFITAAVWMLTAALSREAGWKGSLAPALFALLYGSSPIWAFHGYFVLQLAPVGLGVLLTTALACGDVLIMNREKPAWPTVLLWEAAAAVLLTFCLTIYQSLLVNWLSAVLILRFARLRWDETFHWRDWIRLAIRAVLCTAVSLLIARTLRGPNGAGNMDQQIRWGTLPFSWSLLRIAQEVGATLLMVQSRYFSLYTLGAAGTLLFLIRRFRQDPGKKEWNLHLALCAAAVLLLPFGLSVLLGNVTVPRSQFALQMASSFLAVFTLQESNRRRKVVSAVLIATIVIQVGLCIRLTHTDNLRAAQDRAAAERISAEMTGMDETKPVICTGTLRMNGSAWETEKTDVFGRTFFEWIYEEDQPWTSTDPTLRLLCAVSGKTLRTARNTPTLKNAAERAKSMPCYPESGFVCEEDDCILIHLK